MTTRSRVKPGPARARPLGVSARGVGTRRNLLDAATAVIIDGNGDFEIGAVAARAGVSVGLIYHHFGSKAGLIAAVVEDFYDRYDAEVMDVHPLPGADWPQRERERGKRVIDFHYRDALAPIVFSRLAREPEAAAVEARRVGRHVSVGTRNIRLGQKEGVIPAHLDPNLLVAMMMGGLHRALGEALARRPRPSQPWLEKEIWGSIAALARLPEAFPPQKLRATRGKTQPLKKGTAPMAKQAATKSAVTAQKVLSKKNPASARRRSGRRVLAS
jgi:AcrR family transcriptional regulator